jgi:hypothetical protein
MYVKIGNWTRSFTFGPATTWPPHLNETIPGSINGPTKEQPLLISEFVLRSKTPKQESITAARNQPCRLRLPPIPGWAGRWNR